MGCCDLMLFSLAVCVVAESGGRDQVSPEGEGW